MERLADFLNHGILPFTGRSVELERLHAFWRSTSDAQELRAILVVGEAGSGKSRLIDEMVPGILDAGGAVIHAKLFPESATSIVPLLAQGLWYSEIARRLLRGEPEETVPSVAAALRRISRLRPTLLLIEDVHLLAGDALRELASLLDALAEESISLLATARPVELPVRAPLERFLVDELHLAGLDRAAVETLWTRLFDDPGEQEMLGYLVEATAGNPLALRSALRGAIRGKALAPDPVTASWRSPLSGEALAGAFRRHVDLLAEGMAAHLTDEEREAAATLATLGEVFAADTAGALLDGTSDLIRTLVFRGIIVGSSAATQPLPPAGAGRPPMAFTHTLLHQHLLASATPRLERIVAAMASGLPLYSAVPFQLVAAAAPASALGSDPAVLAAALRRAIDTSYHLDSGPDWKLGEPVLAAADRLLAALDGLIPAEEHLELRLSLMNRTLSALRREIRDERFAAELDRMIALTESELPERLGHFRLRALRHLHLLTAETDQSACAGVWESIEELTSAAPALRATDAYIFYLEEAARTAHRAPDVATMQLVERRLDELLASGTLAEPERRIARLRVAPLFLLLFDSAEELDRRLALARDLPVGFEGERSSFELNRIALLETTGRMSEALEAAGRAAAYFTAAGLARNAAHCRLIELTARLALGADPDRIAAEAAALTSRGGYPSSPSFRRNVGIYLSEIGLLRGAFEWTRAIVAAYQPDEEIFWPEGIVLLGLEDGSLASRLALLEEEPGPLAALASFAAGRGDRAVACREALAVLERPMLRMDDLLLLHVLLSTLEKAGRDALGPEVARGARRAVEGALEWAAERSLAPLIPPLVDRYPRYLAPRDESAWRTRARAMGAGHDASPQGAEAGKVRIGMLGTITAAAPGQSPVTLRGARVRTMLGLLVAIGMTREELSVKEYRRLAAGGEMDPELARKTANMAAVRLREAIGADAVITGKETHLLSLDHVEVDLLEAHAHLEEAREALRRRSLVKAFPAILKTLEITRGEVPFPGLYDDFFEALREDFEVRLRSTTIDVARALLREADPASAGELLGRAFEGMPDDEEIAELLAEALEKSGRRFDVERVRMKSEEALDLDE